MADKRSDLPGTDLDIEYLRFLVWAGTQLGRSLNYHETLKIVCDAAVRTVADVCIIDLGELGDTSVAGVAHRDPQLADALNALGAHLTSDPDRPMHPVCQVLKTGKTYFAPQTDAAWIAANAANDAHAQFMRSMEYASMIIVPLTSQVFGVTGALTLVTTTGGRRTLGADAIPFAENLGRRCGEAIGKASLYRDARDAARRFQIAALPQALPDLPGVRFDGLYEPADSAFLVGGDWYDAFLLPDGRVGISIGDVAGHGIGAAVVMASMKNSMRTALAIETDLNRALAAADYVRSTEDSPERFCTAMLAVLDLRQRTLTCAPAGHPGPKLWNPELGTVEDPFSHRGLPLGCRSLGGDVPAPRTIQLAPGSFVVFYTDGLVEWNRDLLAGESMLIEALSLPAVRAAERPAAAICKHVVRGRTHDDVGVLTFSVDALPGE